MEGAACNAHARWIGQRGKPRGSRLLDPAFSSRGKRASRISFSFDTRLAPLPAPPSSALYTPLFLSPRVPRRRDVPSYPSSSRSSPPPPPPPPPPFLVEWRVRSSAGEEEEVLCRSLRASSLFHARTRMITITVFLFSSAR